MKSLAISTSLYQRADKLMLAIVWALFAISLAVSGIHGTLGIAWTFGGSTAALATMLVVLMPGTRLTRIAMANIAMAFAALHIHQLAGLTEMHFEIFVLLAFLLCYRDWTVIIAAAAAIAGHHLAFNALQQAGFPTICLTEPAWNMILLHAAFVIAEAAVLCYLAVLLQREAMQAAELTQMVESLASSGNGSIDLRGATLSVSSDAASALQSGLQAIGMTISCVSAGAVAMKTGTDHMSDTNRHVANRIGDQTVSLEQLVHTMENLTRTVLTNSGHAGNADQCASNAVSIATESGKVVDDVLQTIDRINGSSSRIVEIIATIDGIAFQTNILALNAAVEAARAGEQGRGFAVVASEVRTLAQSSAAAAREIKSLIEDSVAEIATGHRLAGDAGSAMSNIVRSIEKVHLTVGAIATASKEQVAEISSARNMLDVMQAVSADCTGLIAAATADAEALNHEANVLADVVEKFVTA